jgi:hypothetical protein
MGKRDASTMASMVSCTQHRKYKMYAPELKGFKHV